MKSRLFVVAIVLAFVVTSLGVNVRPAAAAGNVTATCNSLSVNGTTLPVFLVSVIVASHPSILFPLIIADATGAYSASVSISLPAGTVVSGYIVDFIAVPFSVTVPPCSASTGSGNPPWNPNDARVDGRPGDRIAVYCNTNTTGTNANTIGVYGILNNGEGKFLTAFKYSDVVKAGGKGITRSVEPLGTVYISVNDKTNFYVKWMGGPADATGMGDFRKWFTCDFA